MLTNLFVILIYIINYIDTMINDNTQPSARMGRKAYRVLLRQPGCRKITLILGNLFLSQINRKGVITIYNTIS